MLSRHNLCTCALEPCMSIPTLIFRTIRWSAWDGCEAGLEHVDVRPADGGIAVSGVVIAQEEGTRFGLSYRLQAGCPVAHEGCSSSGPPRARAASGEQRQGLLAGERQGAAGPPGLHRYRHPGDSAHQHLADPAARPEDRREHGNPPLLHHRARSDRLPLRSALHRHRFRPLYRFESLESGFTAELPVDEDGFVLDYPGLFKRLA